MTPTTRMAPTSLDRAAANPMSAASPFTARGVTMRFAVLVLLGLGLLPVPLAAQPATTLHHGLALWGEPDLPPDFTHLPYVNPDAPKGGSIVIGSPGTFDNLNPIILRGINPRTLGLTGTSLMTTSGDELDAAYGLLAETVEIPEDLSWAVFALRADARWHDGTPITADDVVFAWTAIQEHGAPFLKSFLQKTTVVEAVDPHRVRARFSTTGEMKPILDLATTLSPLPRHWWTAEGRDVSKTTLEPPVGSGPYRIAAVDPGRSITYERVAGWWGEALPINRGLDNFNSVRVDYYRDDDVLFEAFKAGAYDFRVEYRAQRWAIGYDFPAAEDGRVGRRAETSELPLGAQGFRLNTRRPQFADPRVREALNYLFDFDWLHKNILYGEYKRTTSNFPNSDYGASGPPTAAELAVLDPFRDRLDPRVLSDAFVPPGTGMDSRTSLRHALRLFRAAGWELKNARLVNAATGEPFRIEFIDESPSMTRVVEPYVANLKRAGIDATLRIVDTAQMQVRADEFDFDSTIVNFNFFPPPGPEMWSYFGSEAARTRGSANYSGIADPVVDALIAKVLEARDEATVKAATRALDRVMLWGFYMVPQWYNDETWLAWWDKFGWPQRGPRYDLAFRNNWFPSWWWYDGAKAAKLAGR